MSYEYPRIPDQEDEEWFKHAVFPLASGNYKDAVVVIVDVRGDVSVEMDTDSFDEAIKLLSRALTVVVEMKDQAGGR